VLESLLLVGHSFANLAIVGQLLMGAIEHNRLWYALPLIISFSLVYGATKHEEMSEVLVQGYRAAVWIVGFMFTVFAVVWVIDWLLL
jgi:hypothetical protein